MIKAKVIVQMMGSPKKHIEKTIKDYIGQIKEHHKDIEVVNEDTSNAKKDGDMFSVFSELEINAKDSGALVWFCFDYMPSSVEIIEPNKIVYDTVDFTNFLNDLQAKLHKTDMVIKNLSAENQVVKKNGMTLLKNIILLQIKMGIGDLKTLSVNAGVPEEHIQKFLEQLDKDGKIKKDGKLYKVV